MMSRSGGVEFVHHYAARQNCVFLLQHDGPSQIYQPPRRHLLQAAVSVAARASRQGLVVLQSQREASAVIQLLREVGLESREIKGHSEIVELRSSVNNAKRVPVLIASSNCILHLFCLGLVRMENLGFILFDNLTGANKSHPYCVVMEGAFVGNVPRILGFADWPLVYPGEALQVKLGRVGKWSQYHRVFHSTVLPLILESCNQRSDWVSKEEIDGMSRQQTMFGRLRLMLVDEVSHVNHHGDPADDTQTKLVKSILDVIHSAKQTGNVLIIYDGDFKLLVDKLNNQKIKSLVIKDEITSLSGLERAVLLCKSANLKPKSSVLSCPLGLIIVVDTEPNLVLNSLLSPLSHHVETVFIRTVESASLASSDMASWIGLLATSASSSSVISRELLSFFGNMENLSKASRFVTDCSQVHYRVPSTGAMLIPSINAGLLLAVCSHLSHSQGYLSMRTFPVKRVDSNGVVLDKTHFFMTRIKLPACLAGKYLEPEQLIVHGPLSPRRFTAYTIAAFKAIKLMHNAGILDDHFIPVQDLLNQARVEQAVTVAIDQDNREELEERLHELDELPSNMDQLIIKEVVPDDIRFDEDWTTLSKALIDKDSDIKMDFFLHVYEYETRQECQIEQLTMKEVNLPCDTLIHLTDANFFSSNGNHSIGILLKKPLEGLRGIRVPITGSIAMLGSLKCVGKVSLTKTQIDQVVEFQAFLFGAINTRPIVPRDEDDEDAFIKTEIPADKKVAYLSVFVTKQRPSEMKTVFDTASSLKKYQEFVTRYQDSRDMAQLNGETDQTLNWSVDWDLIAKTVDHTNYRSLEEFAEEVSTFSSDPLGPLGSLKAPVIHTFPDKPPLSIDYFLYSLRRAIVYAPHNGLFYRVSRWHNNLTPNSPFESKTFAECKSYADYHRLRYGLEIEDCGKKGMAEVKRIENFMDINLWISSNAVIKAKNRKNEGFKSLVIPALVKVCPVPYAHLRFAMLLPKIIFDVERQLTAIQCYQDKFFRLKPLWPPKSLMVEALTGPSSAVKYDYERLEILGDSVLKLFTTIDIFMSNRNQGEGKLSRLRQERISNFNLFLLASRLSISFYARLAPFVAKIFSPPDILQLLNVPVLEKKWPYLDLLFDDGVYKWMSIQELDTRSDRRFALFHLYPDGTLIDTQQNAQDPTQLRFKKKVELAVVSRYGHSVPAKCLADTMEALIASFYLGPGGLSGALEFLIEVGLCSEDTRSLRNLDVLKIAGHLDEQGVTIADGRLAIVTAEPSAVGENLAVNSEADFQYAELEEILGYKFKHRRLLFLACTHSSVDLTHSYERLEWLGDAALDWIVIKYYWEGFKDEAWMTPERITQCRQTAVCNEAFARIAVHHGLQKYLRITTPSLQMEIDLFTSAYHGSEENERSLPPAPKILGDLFESIAGAVLLDCHFNMETVGSVFVPLLEFFLDAHADPYNLPDNPLHDFWHDMRISGNSSHVEFSYEVASTIVCRILVRGRVVAEAAGPTRAFARTNAARLAVEYIRTRGWRDFCPVTCPYILTKTHGATVVDYIFNTFLIDQQNIQVVARLLTYSEYNFPEHFQHHGESEERMAELQSFIEDQQLHGSIFSVQKLFMNPKLAYAMFTHERLSYNFNLVGDVCLQSSNYYVFSDPHLQRQFLTQAIPRISQLHNTRIFQDHISLGSKEDVAWLFGALEPHMTPILLEIFLGKQGWICDEFVPFMNPLHKNDNARHMRRLMVVLTLIRVRRFYGIAYEQKLVHDLWATLCDSDANIDSKPFQMTASGAEKMYEKTLAAVVQTENSSYWCILAALLLQMYEIKGIDNDLLAAHAGSLLSNVRFLSPYYSQQLITKLSSRSKVVQTFDAIPLSHRPAFILPLPDKVRRWRYCGPFSMLSKNVELNSDSIFEDIIEFVFRFRIIPLNMWIYDAKDGTFQHVSELAIRKAEQILEARALNLAGINGLNTMRTIFMAWAFLLMDRQTMDLSCMFVASDVTWQDFYERIACTYDCDVSEVLEMWGISSHFTLHELRSLIDQSYQAGTNS
ncbi:hypothetical protein PSACC_00742 [Paramicrosporidium saccamoebae]|uniref:RNase III domain-containing protein n=1 Tax=Paramicrosporidium saccamoebae TaxID=1246581 RepID=A0A2H9TNX9_9FUNG|nr:hypothetical protein PSACC_00742 [Paramicrosporidium saccamoebae]